MPVNGRPSAPAIAIRAAGGADVAAIGACVDAAYRHYVARIGKPPAPMLTDYRRMVDDDEGAGRLAFVAVERPDGGRATPAGDAPALAVADGVVVGVLVLARSNDDLLLDNVAVHPARQRIGLGRRLIEFAERTARQQDCAGVVLYTHEAMYENQKLYAALGYRETGRRSEDGYQRVYLRKPLPAALPASMPPALVIHVGTARAPWWLERLQALLPEFDCRPWAQPGNRAEVGYAVVWKPPPGGLKTFPALRCIVSMGAGIDHILTDPELPPAVPIIRLTGPDLVLRMREYVLLHVLRLHRRLPELVAARQRREWRQLLTPPASRCRVGVMGLGQLGADCAQALAAVGFDAAGWTRRQRTLTGVRCYAGDDQLDAFLAGVRILVCLLPLTAATERILDRRVFDRLVRGAYLINVGRGRHLHEPDLLDALDRGQLAGAVLDVFEQEPLPAGHPFWDRPEILITPHVGSLIDPDTGGELIADSLRRFVRGEALPNLVDAARGY